jgi:hypothetical protein
VTPPAAKPSAPSPLERLLLAPLRAGLLGSGVFLWTTGIIITARRAEGLPPGEDLAFAAAAIVGWVAAVAAGFRERAPGRAAFAKRVLAGGFASAAWAAAMLGGLTVATPIKTERLGRLLVLGVVSMVAAVAWIHGRRLVARDEGRRARRGIAAVSAVVALLFAWCAFPRVRCALGSGFGCATASLEASHDGDPARATRLADRGCLDLANGASCVVAGDLRWQADSTVPGGDRDRAATLFRRACEAGDEEGCGREGVLGLQRDCEGGSGKACRSLALRTRDDALRLRYYEEACRLGDQAACETVAWAKPLPHPR